MRRDHRGMKPKNNNEKKTVKSAKQLNLLELSVIVLGLFGSISPSGSMQI